MPDTPFPSEPTSGKGKAAAAKAQEKWESEYARIRRIKTRSRATLIICPLSTVANWEEQFREHWAGEVYVMGGAGGAPCPPIPTPASAQVAECAGDPNSLELPSLVGEIPEDVKDGRKTQPASSVVGRVRHGNTLRVYVYHGNARRPDPKFLADFDAVITTYATLASEFSKQNKSVAACDDDDDDEDGEEAFGGSVEIDEYGNQVIKLPKPKEKKGLKRKKTAALFSGAVEATSALQSIHWFRVVLDEAQYVIHLF